MCSPWTTWTDLLARHAEAEGHAEKLQVFWNTALGESWGPPAAEMPEADVLMARAEPWPEGTVPMGGCFLTAGCDVQADRLEIEVVAWGRDFESWSVDYQVLYGDVAEPGVWQRLDELLARSWPHVSGMPLQIQAACIDAGFSAAEVTAFTRSRHARRIYSSKGLSQGFGKPIWPRRASWTKDKHAIYTISSDEAKLWVANRMRVEQTGAGFMHTPLSRERGWYEQLTAEKLVILKGQRRWTNPLRQRNEALDARCLAAAALHSRLLGGLDLRQWCDAFDEMLRPAKPDGMPAPPAVVRSNFVWG
jgi:phage terminase large subunit GpA-like protein